MRAPLTRHSHVGGRRRRHSTAATASSGAELKLGHIGAGTFGAVSFELVLLTNRRVASKKQAVNSLARQREFALLSALGRHPCEHAATMLDHCTTKGSQNRVWMHTVHALAGSALWKVFHFSRGSLPDDRIARYMFGVASGLSHLRSLDVVHADCSLKNMLLMREDRVQVADLGAAFSAFAVINYAEEIATAYARSPERMLGEIIIRSSIDVWAFGVQLYCLRAGKRPWLELPGDDSPLRDTSQLVELTKVLGCLPVGSPLRQLPKWPALAEVLDVARSSASWDGWSDAALELLKVTMRWDASEPASSSCFASQMLRSRQDRLVGAPSAGSAANSSPASAYQVVPRALMR